ncbi:MAG: MBOAT family protein [Planctomycetota bacterium]|nr:MBOAT family protein [Planctomycetota bacterium]
MVFNSLHFFAFFALVWTGVLLLRTRIAARNLLLLAASYYFYGWWDWRFLGLLIFSTVVDYICGRLMGAKAPDAERGRRDRIILALSMVVSLGLLGFFKYYGFFVDSAVAALTRLGFQAHLSSLKIILPVGISFYTFQTMSYTIDVYRGHVPPARSLLNFALFVAFFPQLVAGPIERATALLPQFSRPTIITWPGLSSGTYLICSGLFKKVVLADNAATVVQWMFSQNNPNGWEVILGAYAFTLQVYCDFSGYSDIARGTARWMGFELMKNFNQPYLATNPADFWARWHISLSTWLRDYLFIPLGGTRKGPLRSYVNIMIVLVLAGLWHGAAWTYVVWGSFHGIILCAHRAIRPWLEKYLNPQQPFARRAWHVCRVLIFFHIAAVGPLLFRSQNLQHVGEMFAGFGRWPVRELLKNTNSLAIVAGGLLVLLAVQLAKELSNDAYILLRLPIPARAILYAAGILVFLAFGDFYGEPFIYFQF